MLEKWGFIMKKYEYVSVKMGSFLCSELLGKHREIINGYAEKGYRYAGYIPTKIENGGRIMEIDLIFEIDCED